MHLFVQVVSGLFYLHDERSLVHRDLKPDNILVSGDGLLKIIDFNVACSTKDGEPLTPTGTREVLAPEVLRGEQPCVSEPEKPSGIFQVNRGGLS